MHAEGSEAYIGFAGIKRKKIRVEVIEMRYPPFTRSAAASIHRINMEVQEEEELERIQTPASKQKVEGVI
jgi:hypothetical protein